jgi:calcium channel MID1
MLLSKFAPAQSRLLTFVVATCFLLSVSSSSQPHFVHASDVPAAPGIDALSQPVLHAPPDAFTRLQSDNGHSNGDEGYAPEFDYFERSLLGRQEPQKPQVDELKNNEKKNMEINPGATAYFVFKRGQRAKRSDNPGGEDVAADWGEPKVDDNDVGDKLRTRQADNRVWISANTCRQPTANGTAKPKSYPQLVMFVSTSPKNQKPGPDSLDGLATPPSGVLFENGFASFDLQADTDIYVGISAPNLDKDLVGSWSFEIAASVDGSYYSYNASNPFLFMVDNDSESALFITYNLSDLGTNDTNKWRDYNPFRMYAFSTGDETPITGMEHSLCALKDRKNQTNVTVAMSITTKFGGELPKSQFHIQGLEAGKKYNGFLTAEGGKDALQLPGNGTIRGGGMVFQQFEFTTKTGTYISYTMRLSLSYAKHPLRRLLPSNL